VCFLLMNCINKQMFDRFPFCRTVPLAGLEMIAFLLLAGCTSTNPQPAFNNVAGVVHERTGQSVQWLREETDEPAITRAVAQLLEGNLTAQSATAIALLNNRSLQAQFEDLGISQAELAQASRLRNPAIVAMWRIPDRPPSAADVEYSAALNFLDLLTLPARKKIAAQELEQTKLRVADEVLRLAADTQAAFYAAQAHQALAARLEIDAEVDRAAATIATRQHEAGDINDLTWHTVQASLDQSRLELAQARAQALASRERLNRLLGLWGPQTGWKIFNDLASVPNQEIALENLEPLALRQRLDLAAARSETEALAKALKLKADTRWVPGLTLGIDTERQTDGQNITGPFLGIELPIFDQGQPALAKLAAQYRQAQRRYEALSVNVRADVRTAGDALTAARDMALTYEKSLLPARRRILQETLLQYNAMQLSSYELLAAKTSAEAAERGYIETLRDYWTARADLERAVGGNLAPASEISPQAPAGVPPAAESDHNHNISSTHTMGDNTP
jgi:cobalt-zinc-cadmium efflux system outer membrane protein